MSFPALLHGANTKSCLDGRDMIHEGNIRVLAHQNYITALRHMGLFEKQLNLNLSPSQLLSVYHVMFPLCNSVRIASRLC